ncbi:MAG: DegV family protein [Firmicutes bacterium]|nr:DegV family protein [Bacillota bacterium]MCL2771607.1 DegV family protein [Bacillota bacterium]
MEKAKFYLMTDSTSDISQKEAKELGITVIPLGINFGMESYKDGVDLSTKEFFDKLVVCKELPKTSLLSDEQIHTEVLKHIDKTEVVMITISSALSGTHANAERVKRELPAAQGKKFHVIDSETVTIALGALVFELAKMRDLGYTAAEAVAEAEKLREKVVVLAIVDSLKFLKMGGRLKSSTAIIGGLLGIKPIMSVKDKMLANIGKSIGIGKARSDLFKIAGGHEIDLEKVFFAGHGDNIENAKLLGNMAKEKLNVDDVTIRTIGAAVGTHVGPSSSGIAYFKK